MKIGLRVSAGACALGVCLAWQVSAAPLVLPNGASAVEGAGSLTGPLANADLTLQWVVAESQLGSLGAGTALNGIGFRLNGGAFDGPGLSSTFADWTLQLSQSANSPGLLSPTFAANIGADVVTVRSGPLTVSAGALSGGAGPNPFYFVAFSTPYSYLGGDLLFTLRQDAVAGAPILPLDALPLNEVAGIGDTVRGASATAVDGQAQFVNFPVTALSLVPEPAPVLLMLTALGLGVVARICSRVRGGRALGAPPG